MPMRSDRGRSSAGAVALGGTATVVCILPLFLTGALAVQVMRELSFGSTGLGLAVALPRATSAALSPFLGRSADRLGATRSIRFAAILAAIASLGIAVTAHRWATLVAWLVVSACAQAIGQPAANRMLTNVVRPNRLGIAFGVKQSAPPTATMLAGLSVPLIALTLGWRWAYVLAGALAVAVAFTVRSHPTAGNQRQPRAPGGSTSKLHNRRLVWLLMFAVGLATFASTAATTFYVDAAVGAGSAARFAGTMLAIASIAAISCRVLLGAASDRMATGHLKLCAALVAVGSLGIAMLATGRPGWMAAGILIALAGTWGYNSVFWFTLVRAYPGTPGRATGAVQPGALLGATSGPLVFGLLVDNLGYPPAWALAGIAAVVGTGVMLAAGRELARTELRSTR